MTELLEYLWFRVWPHSWQDWTFYLVVAVAVMWIAALAKWRRL